MADAAGLWVVVGALAAGVPQLLTAAVQSVSVRGQRKHDAAQAQVQRDADAADREAQRKHDAAQAQHANNPTAVLWPRRLHGNHAVKPPLY